MDRRRRRGFNLPKRPYTDPPKSSLKPDSKPTVWVGGAKGSFAKGNPSAPIIQLTPQPCIDVFDAFCCKAKEVLNVDLTNPPSSIHVHTDADDAYVIDACFPLDMSVPNMIARFELRPFKANMNEVSVRVWGKMCSGAENQQQRANYERLCDLVAGVSTGTTSTVRALSTTEDVRAFVHTRLLNPQRQRPCIVVTEILSSFWPSWSRGASRIDPMAVVKQFESIADVVSIRGKKSSFALSKALQEAGIGKSYSCFDGGVRVYAPNMSADDSLLQHPLLTKFRLYKLDDAQVLDNVEAALRGVGFRLVRADDIHATLSSRSRPSLPEREEHTELSPEATPLKQIGGEEQEQNPPLVEALERMEERYPTYIHVQKSAFRSARKCKRQVDASEVAEMLDVLGEVAKRWKENAGSLGATFALVVERELKSHQIPAKCVGNESDTTMNKFGNSRVFDGRQMQAHVTYKRRDFQRCLHLFFEADAELGIVLIGYLGDHLDN